MTFSDIIWKNSLRNKRRTFLTVLTMALGLFVLSTLATLVNEIERSLEDSSPVRITTRHAVSFTNFLPLRYRSQIEQVSGVAAVTPFTFFGGIYIDQAHTDFTQFACDPATLLDVFTSVEISAEQEQAFIKRRTGAIVGQRKAERHGWKVGDRITILGGIFPFDLELTIEGIFTGSANDESSIFFHHEYLEEAMEGVWGRRAGVGMYWMRAESIDAVPRIMEQIDALFQNSEAPTKTETERAFTANFFNMLGNVKGLVATISGMILFSLALVTANSLAMSVRERTREIAVMKALGFSGRSILSLLMVEGVALTLTGGLIGCIGARVFYSVMIMEQIAALTLNFIQRFEITWGIMVLGILIAAGVGLLATAVPAYRAVKTTVAEGLRYLG